MKPSELYEKMWQSLDGFPTKDYETTYFDFIQAVITFTKACEEAEAKGKGSVFLLALIKGRIFLCCSYEEVLAKQKERHSRFIHAVYRVYFIRQNEYQIEKL